MPDPRSLIVAAAALCAIGSAACEDPTGPLTYGTFVLREGDGQALPLAWEPGGGERYELLADTLELSSGERFRRARVLRITELSSGVATQRVEAWEGAVVRRDGTWALLQDICGSDSLALCLEPPTIRAVGEDMEIRTGAPPATVLRFERMF